MQESPKPLVRLFNTAFNPFEHRDIIDPSGGRSDFVKGLAHASALFLTYGGTAFVLRSLIHKQLKVKKYRDREKIRAFVGARFPMIEAPIPDEILREEALAKQGSEKEAVWPFRETVEEPLSSPKMLALTTAAVVGGGLAGWKLADWIADLKQRSKLEEEIKAKRKALSDLTRLEYLQTRGLGKESSEKEAIWPFSKREPKIVEPGVLKKTIHGVKSLYWLWALGFFAISYASAKRYMDVIDPARTRQKEIEKLVRRRARAERAPQLLPEPAVPLEEGAVKPLEPVRLPGARPERDILMTR